MPVTVEYFTDILCIWAWGNQIRIEQLRQELGDDIQLRYRFIPVFADARRHILGQWAEKGGFEGFNHHLKDVAQHWDHLTLHPDVWVRTVPASSTGVHLILKAMQLLEERGDISGQANPVYGGRSCFEEYVWRLREAFFHHGDNISERSVYEHIAYGLGLESRDLQEMISNGEAFAALHRDDAVKQRYKVHGSPTMVLNEGRQLLYGNVGYRIIEVNVRELLHNPIQGEASWC